MTQEFDPGSDEPDDQENPFTPAGYTYFGQFIDHDLTFDNRSTLQPIPSGLSSFPSNERTPRLDLDCLYGLGPNAAPFMYMDDGKLVTNPDRAFDLPRARTLYSSGDPGSFRAIIGDPRNDENSIVCQLQLAFIRLHNAIVEQLKGSVPNGDLFKMAQREVRFTYQRIIVDDFLRRIVRQHVYDDFVNLYRTQGAPAFRLYKPGAMRDALPLEFTGAGYRFGHSMIRPAYRLNNRFDFKALLFVAASDPQQSLVGFGELPENHQIEWPLFFSNAVQPGTQFPNDVKAKTRLQFAYKIDSTLVNPLAHLPARITKDKEPFNSLPARNLKRGYNFSLPSGQAVARFVPDAKTPPLLVGDQLKDFASLPISAADAAALEHDTPLWLYILLEAQAQQLQGDGSFKKKPDGSIDKDANTGAQLGPVGGRIVLETFFGLLDSDLGSYVHDKSWSPLIKPGAAALTMWDVLSFIGAV